MNYKPVIQTLLQDIEKKNMDKSFVKDTMALVILSAYDSELIDGDTMIQLSWDCGLTKRATKYFVPLDSIKQE